MENSAFETFAAIASVVCLMLLTYLSCNDNKPPQAGA